MPDTTKHQDASLLRRHAVVEDLDCLATGSLISGLARGATIWGMTERREDTSVFYLKGAGVFALFDSRMTPAQRVSLEYQCRALCDAFVDGYTKR